MQNSYTYLNFMRDFHLQINITNDTAYGILRIKIDFAKSWKFDRRHKLFFLFF